MLRAVDVVVDHQDAPAVARVERATPAPRAAR